MRRGYIALTILLISLSLLIINGWLTPSNKTFPFDTEPRFLGYRSDTIRINPINITQLPQTAHGSGYNVTTGQRRMDGEYVQGDFYPTPESNFQLTYSASGNYTYFHLAYPEHSNVTDWLWDTLKDSLNLTDPQLEGVKESATSQWWVDAGGAHLGTYIDGVKPDWERLAKHLGTETSRENKWVGIRRISFDSGANMTLYSDALLISGRVAGGEAVLVVNVDGDSDLCLYVDSPSKVEDPIKLFAPMFEALGIPGLGLSRLSLEESWAYPL